MANLDQEKNKVGPNPQRVEKKAKKDKAKKEIDKVLDNSLKTELDAADSHEARVELLLTQIVIELKAIKVK